ncbi:MAG: hypothetical protein LUC22_00165, partial [Prevotella sp.]|nr:hypothetical protein [Prevotella sp.]
MDEKNNFTRYAYAYNYAYNILHSTPKFKDFAVALMDFLGGPEPYIPSIYKQLLDEVFPSMVNVADDLSEYSDIESAMRNGYADFLKAEEKKKRATAVNIKEDVDELHRKIKAYRSTDKFREMLRFSRKFHYLSPFNAMLVSWQKP